MVQIYLAGALFSQAERDFNKKLQQMMLESGFSVFLPQEDAEDNEDERIERNNSVIFLSCLSGLQKSDMVVAVLDGTDVDSGTAWELGYAYAAGKPIIGIRTDFRIQTPGEKVNLMIQETLTDFAGSVSELKTLLFNAY
ncbi:MAG: nucleoside 2-deoxyribosyltransferase [Methanosarcinales archaeon]|jgi:nucleoside 2-deoxyribosyltransferase|nr:nucleoside 2-deoxyribosyltransferase [Methanosarcinales archaeon]